MKKAVSLLLGVAILICFSGTALAVTLTCWYSDSTTGCLTSNGASIQICGYTSFSKSTLDDYLKYAVTQWKNAGVSTEVVTSSPLVSLYCGDLAYLQNQYPGYQDNWRGLTSLTRDLSKTATYTYNGTSYTIETVSSANMYLLYRPKDLGENEYKHTLMHEIGHVVGWWVGHSNSSKTDKYGQKNQSIRVKYNFVGCIS